MWAKSFLNEKAPELTVETWISKKPDTEGKFVIIDFWATWCLPCLFQLPEFEKLSEKYPDIRFIGISIDQNEKLWVKRLKKDGMPAHIQEVLADPYVVAMPGTLLPFPVFCDR